MATLDSIFNAVLEGSAPAAQAGVKAALAEGIAPDTILKDGLIAAMGEVGRLFEENEYFVPEMLVSARAMHDIGKNLVGMMLEGAGFEVVDLGTDVTPEKFVNAVKERGVQLIGLSALLTTTMPSMSATVKALTEAGIRDRVKVMIGGAPVTDAYARQIGADGYAPDASSAVRLAKALVA
jgi:5-methyltetrahydrofolate--homocysteine methyltransferase